MSDIELRRPHGPEIERARELRKRITGAERLLWSELRGKKIEGLRFRRQHPLGSYIADFVCLSVKLIVELDGETHLEPGQKTYDRRRTIWLNRQGYRVLRFWNEEVSGDLALVLTMIAHEVRSLSKTTVPGGGPPPAPSLGGRG